MFNNWNARYLPSSFPQSLALYDFVRADIAKAYIKEKRVKQATVLAEAIQLEKVKAELWFDIASAFHQEGFF